MNAGLVQAAVTVCGAMGAVATWRREPRHPLVIAAAATGPIASTAGAAAGSLCALTGNALLGGVNLALALIWRAGALRGNAKRSESNNTVPALTVTGANLLMTNDNADAARRLATVDSDVIVTLETSPAMRDRLGEALEHHELVATGSGRLGELAHLWIRRELGATGSNIALTGESTLPAAEIDIDGRTITIVGVHLDAPVSRRAERIWRGQLDSLRHWSAGREDYILIGDFNAASNHPGMRDLIAQGRDAASAIGRPLLRTWPVRGFKKGRGRLWPMLGLDHAITGRTLTVNELRTDVLPGADHLALSVIIGCERTDRS